MASRLHGAFVAATGIRTWSVVGVAIALSTLVGCGAGDPAKEVEAKELAHARKLYFEADWLFQQGNAVDAVVPAREALEIRRRVLGEGHPDFAASLDSLATLFEWMGDYREAERLFLKALDVRKKVLGEDHPRFAESLADLGELYELLGDYTAAEPLLLQARDLRKRVLSEEHPDYIDSLCRLGLLYHSMGEYAAAEPLLVAARDLTKNALGEDEHYAICVNNLALLYKSMGESDKALRLFVAARDLTKKVLGEKAIGYPVRLNNLACLYSDMGDYASAEPLMLQSCDLARESLGEKHPYYLCSLNNLADLYHRMGEIDKARPLYLECRDLLQKAVGGKHPDYAFSLANLAWFYHSVGEYDKAESLFLKARALLEETLGKAHPRHAGTLCSLAELYRDKGDYDRADSLYRQSLEFSRQLLDETASVQSEQQQMKFSRILRYRLDHYISLSLITKQYGRAVFNELLDWKGATLVRQRRLRAVAGQPEVAQTFAALQTTTRQLSALLRAVPPPTQQTIWQRQIEELTEKKDGLEAELVQKSDRYRAARQRIRVNDLLAVLPDDTALVDLLEFRFSRQTNDLPKRHEPQPHFVAFVVRHGQPVEPIDLGPAADINQAVTDWRKTFGASPESAEAGEFLRKRVWEPLEPRLEGARRVLISPDRALGRLPFYALPGKKPNSYLIEDYVIASIPVPQLLPSLVQPLDGKRPRGDLLLIGDVDYGADPQGAESLTNERRPQQLLADLSFPPLPATAEEIASIADLYASQHTDAREESVRTMRRAQVTESAFRREAADYRMLHLATHGYFADPTKESAFGTASTASDMMLTRLFGQSQAVSHVRGYHPGLLSGLALSGANRTPQSDQDDGILTAQEIAFLPLEGVELVVLSACETGLGPTAGGEGLLGVQRAFQVAGARTTVASLWKVDDRATAALMRLFYYKLWHERKAPVDALRESQLALYRQPSQIEGLATTRGPKFGEVVKIVESQQDQPTQLDPSDRTQNAPIGQWAAFVLSGDWR